MPENTPAVHGAADAADQIRVNGYTLLPGLLKPALVSRMRDAFDALLEERMRSEPSNRGANRYQMYLPFEPPFANSTLYENDAVLEIAGQVLGPDIECVYFASDTPLPGSDYQRVHSDTRLLFPEARHSLPPYGLVLNIPLVDVTEENGPLEIWPGGTHLWDGRGDIQELASRMVSQRMLMKAGDAIIRDLRMWHRGTPNRGLRSRPNIALVYVRSWYRFEQQAPSIRRDMWEGLSERARRLFRHAQVLESLSESQVTAAMASYQQRQEQVQEEVRRRELVYLLVNTVTAPDSGSGRGRLPELLGMQQDIDSALKEYGDLVVEELIRRMDSASDYRTYYRLATSMAHLAIPNAAESLIQHVRRQQRFSAAAVNALADCRHASVVPALLDILLNGTRVQRPAAAQGLLRRAPGLAIGPLCHMAADPHCVINTDAIQYLQGLGRPDHVIRPVLMEDSLDPTERVRVIAQAAQVLHFDALRELERMARGNQADVSERAREAESILRDQTTLLHPAATPADQSLLHPAAGPHRSPEGLVRPADAASGPA